ncbi:hypothetical protein ACFLTD_04915 [Elusimicrobiota bacterium]
MKLFEQVIVISKGLPYVVIWLFCIILVVNLFNLVFSRFQLEFMRRLSIYFFVAMAYSTCLVPAVKLIGKTFSYALGVQMNFIKKNTADWIFAGIFIFFILAVSNAALKIMFFNALKSSNGVFRVILLICAEGIIATQTVAILSTISMLIKNYILKDKDTINLTY